MIHGSSKRRGEREEHQHHNNQLNKNEGNMNPHIFPTEAGVRSAYGAKADRTTTQNKQAKQQGSKWTWCTTKHKVNSKQHPSWQQWRLKQACAWQSNLRTKPQRMQYLSTCLQQFLMECGKAHAILNNTVWQSDQEDFIIALFKMVATAMGSNIAVRQSPAYTSQEQGSVEHFHRTLMGQVRAFKLQLENNYGNKLSSKHPIMLWLVKRAAYLLNRVLRPLGWQHKLLQTME